MPGKLELVIPLPTKNPSYGCLFKLFKPKKVQKSYDKEIKYLQKVQYQQHQFQLYQYID